MGRDLNCEERCELWGEMWTVRRDVDCEGSRTNKLAYYREQY